MTGSASSEYTMEIKKNPRLKLGLAGLAQFSKKKSMVVTMGLISIQ